MGGEAVPYPTSGLTHTRYVGDVLAFLFGRINEPLLWPEVDDLAAITDLMTTMGGQPGHQWALNLPAFAQALLDAGLVIDLRSLASPAPPAPPAPVAAAEPTVTTSTATTPTVAAGPSPVDRERSAIAGWLAGLRSENSRQAYRRDLGLFAGWVAEHGGTLEAVTATAVEAWMAERAAIDAPSTLARRTAAIASFYGHATKPGRWLDGRPNPASGDMITRPQASSAATSARSASEIAALVAAAARPGRHGHPARDAALVLLMATTGLRVSEVCAANVGDITTEQGNHRLTVTGKGRRVRAVPVAAGVAHYLDLTRPDDAPLIADNEGGRLTPAKVRRALTRLGGHAGVEGITPHQLRATMITEALAAGAPLWATQDLAGHADPRTTRGYQRRSQSAAEAAAIAAALTATFTTETTTSPVAE